MRRWRRTARNIGKSSARGSLAATPRGYPSDNRTGSPNLPFLGILGSAFRSGISAGRLPRRGHGACRTARRCAQCCSLSSIWSSCNPVQIYRACMSRSAHDRADEAHRPAALPPDEVALVHERFAEEHESAAESLSGDLAEADRGAADKHKQAAREDRDQAQTAREEAETEHA
jgi:hypothetical protein